MIRSTPRSLKRNRKIERLERELRELKNAQEGFDQQRSKRQRSRSHSGSCESSHRFPKRFEKNHRAQRSSKRSKSGEKARKAQPLHKPEKEDHNSVWKQLQQISHSPFSSKIERAKLPTKFASLNLISYNGKIDLVAHLSHYKQSMVLYNRNDSLMCRIFPSSLAKWRSSGLMDWSTDLSTLGKNFPRCSPLASSPTPENLRRWIL